MARTIYFAENTAANGTLAGAPVAERAAFMAQLQGVGSEGFEGFALGAVGPLLLTFPGSAGNISATMQTLPPVYVYNNIEIRGAPSQGRFNTTPEGAQYVVAFKEFEIVFDTPIAAFGFYGTDIGDFNAPMQIKLTDSHDNEETLELATTIPSPNGALLFWGFIDDSKTYTKLTMLIAQADGVTDVYGFDDMVVGDPVQAGVEPPGDPWVGGCQVWPAGLGTA